MPKKPYDSCMKRKRYYSTGSPKSLSMARSYLVKVRNRPQISMPICLNRSMVSAIFLLRYSEGERSYAGQNAL